MKSKYFYNGEPLVDYCKKNNIKYNHLTKYISVELKKDPSRSTQDLIEEYINKSHKTYNRYLINGMSLIKYCEMINANYYAIAKAISRAKSDPRYKDLDEDERTNMILDKYLVGKDTEEFRLDEPKKLILEPEKKTS